MVKRKADSESEEDAQFSDASSEPKKKTKPPPKKPATSKKAKSESAPVAEPSAENVEDTGLDAILKNKEGEKYIDLGKKKRATVRSFKEIPLLDIREFYGPEADERPGKKGISLTLEQWHVLKANVEIIDELFSEISKKGSK